MPIVRFLVYSNLFVSVITGFLAYSVCRLIKFENTTILTLCVSLFTLFAYNLHRIQRFKISKIETTPRTNWITNNKLVLFSLIYGSLLMVFTLYLIFLFNASSLLLISICGGISFFYASNYGFFAKPLRSIPFLKIIWITLCWTIICLIWPVVAIRSLPSNYLFLILSGFFYVFAATIPFDIRDKKFDLGEIITLPISLGDRNAKIVAHLAILISFLFYYLYSEEINVFTYIAHFGLLLLIAFSNSNRSEFYFSILIEGWIAVYAMGILNTSIP